MNTTVPTVDEMKALLKENKCVIKFTKVNGELRTMPCTLMASVLPAAEPVASDVPPKAKKEHNPNILNVWCTDKNAWRSCRIDSITGFEVEAK